MALADKTLTCRDCGKEFEKSSDFVCPDGYGKYYCLGCAREIVENFNVLVHGEAGLNTNNMVGVPLGDIAKLLNMLEWQEQELCFVITHKKQHEIIKSYEHSEG